MKSDEQLKADISAELAWDPAVRSGNIDVTVSNGMVTLRGTVDSNIEMHAVTQAVRRIAGVRGLAADLQVQLASGHRRGDAEIAQAARDALHWHSLVPDDQVTVDVKDGWVTLEGEVDWAYQQATAEHCVRPLIGVRGITNNVGLKPHANPLNLGDQISAALVRHARHRARDIRVEVEGGQVTLSGTVDSLAERDAVIGTVLGARGVSRVIDRLEIEG